MEGLSLQEFIDIADSGDLLFFRSKNFSGKV